MAKSTHSAIVDPRNENVKIYINGSFYNRENAQISVFDSGFLVGDGIWEGLRLHNGKFAFLNKHLDRLFAGASAIHLDIGLSREELVSALIETVEVNEMTDDVHVRLMITRGDKKTPSQHPSNVIGGPNIVIIAEHKVADPSVTQEGKQVAIISVSGMVCDFCARGIEKTFAKDKTVLKVDVDLSGGKVLIAYSQDKNINFEEIQKKILSNGQNATDIQVIKI